MKKISKVVIPVAGLGTRMLPATKAIPKEMLPVANKPIIQYIVEEVTYAGFKEVILVTHSSKNSIENHFDKSFELEATLEKRVKRKMLKEIKALSKLNISIQSVRQGEAKGLGHAILCAKKLIGEEPFGIILPDMLISKEKGNIGDSFKEMKLNFEKFNISSVLLGKVKKEDIHKYGIAEIKNNSGSPNHKLIKNIIEKPTLKKAPSNFYAVGRYIFKNDFFTYLSNETPDKFNEIQLTSAIQKYVKDKNDVIALFFNGEIFDCGDSVEYLLANLVYSTKNPYIKTKVKNYLKKNLF